LQRPRCDTGRFEGSPLSLCNRPAKWFWRKNNSLKIFSLGCSFIFQSVAAQKISKQRSIDPDGIFNYDHDRDEKISKVR
jgi:hypothetical protein